METFQSLNKAPEVCQQYASGKAFEEAARNYSELTLLLFTVNLGLIITGRFMVRENPQEINILGKTLYKFETDLNQKLIIHLDRILFTVSFSIISLLTVLQFVPFGIIK